MKNETQSEFIIRYTHIKLHSKCLCRLTIELIKGKISICVYFKKANFFIQGVIRALQLRWYHVSDVPKNHILLGKK